MTTSQQTRQAMEMAADLVRRGQAAARRGERQRATRLLRSALMADPASTEARLWLAGLTEDPREALQLLNEVLQMQPGHVRAAEGLCWAWERLQTQASARVVAPAPLAMQLEPLPEASDLPDEDEATAADEPPQDDAGRGRPERDSRPQAGPAESVVAAPQPQPTDRAAAAPTLPARAEAAPRLRLRPLANTAAVAPVAGACEAPDNAGATRDSRGHTPPKPARRCSPANHAVTRRTRRFGLASLATALLCLAGAVALSMAVPGMGLPAQELPGDVAALVVMPETGATPTEAPAPMPTPTEAPTCAPSATPTEPAARQLTTPTPQAPAQPGHSGKWIEVSLGDQTAIAWEGDTPVRQMIISTGTAATPTVTGSYHIYLKRSSQTLSGPGYSLPNVPHLMYFYRGYALHGAYWHTSFGTPMSHGCVNLSQDDAAWLFDWTGPQLPSGAREAYATASNPGTLVVVHEQGIILAAHRRTRAPRAAERTPPAAAGRR
ncbi:MAG TPA: L,D-transpeptidase family protein [Anaerolineae bacterium]|nr:L,D-transpeptidase family protein [Anaerolineae bacterium]HOQ97248.1 L,D-transpeptidase family protein [Anaerolineae bacterium]HPL27650.1 L,D-transpeptidase family protein [Anaerolineae bacterium]